MDFHTWLLMDPDTPSGAPKVDQGGPREANPTHHISENEPMELIDFETFQAVDIRVGRIIRAEVFPEARKPAYRLWLDFGPDVGEKQSSAQLTGLYSPSELEDRLVLAVVNFPPRQIGPFRSDVLILGVPDADGQVVLVGPDTEVPPGARLH
jgi:tRNA-binding protein